jgi:hypothetical protein
MGRCLERTRAFSGFKTRPEWLEGMVKPCSRNDYSIYGVVEEMGDGCIRARPISQGHIYIMRGK